MCQRTPAAGLTVPRRAACPWCALAVVWAVAALPALAQQPAAPAPTSLPPPRTVEYPTLPDPTAAATSSPAPAPGTVVPAVFAEPASTAAPCCPPHEINFPVAELTWGPYAETGPVFPISGPLERHLNSGWSVAAGVREWRACPRGAVFAELAGEYMTMGTVSMTQETGVNVFFPDTAIRNINNFYLTDLGGFQQFGIHGAVGWNYYPDLFNEPAGDSEQERTFFLTSRLGFRGGGVNGSFDQTPTSSGLTVLRGFNGQHDNPTNNPARIRIVDQVQRNVPYYGPFASVGVGLTWRDATIGALHLGTVYLTAELELAYEMTDFGQYLHEADLFFLSPQISLSFAF